MSASRILETRSGCQNKSKVPKHQQHKETINVEILAKGLPVSSSNVRVSTLQYVSSWSVCTSGTILLAVFARLLLERHAADLEMQNSAKRIVAQTNLPSLQRHDGHGMLFSTAHEQRVNMGKTIMLPSVKFERLFLLRQRNACTQQPIKSTDYNKTLDCIGRCMRVVIYAQHCCLIEEPQLRPCRSFADNELAA